MARAHHRPRKRRPLVRFHVEGRRTEKDYFDHLCVNLRLPRKFDPKHGAAQRLVDRAIQNRRRYNNETSRQKKAQEAEPDLFCCVFDHEHPNIAVDIKRAHQHDIVCAISRPCFELWLLLHFRESPGPANPRTLTRMLREFLPRYEKALTKPMLNDLDQRRTRAMERARRLHQQAVADGQPWRNPVTTVHILVARLEELSARLTRRP